jgi:hypothetical protein
LKRGKASSNLGKDSVNRNPSGRWDGRRLASFWNKLGRSRGRSTEGCRVYRFAVIVLAGVVVSLVLILVLLATTTTPHQARAERAVPELPPPTMRVVAGDRPGVVAVPVGAIVTDARGRTWVRVSATRGARRVEVVKVRSWAPASDQPRLIEATGTELAVGDLVELMGPGDAQTPLGSEK